MNKLPINNQGLRYWFCRLIFPVPKAAPSMPEKNPVLVGPFKVLTAYDPAPPQDRTLPAGHDLGREGDGLAVVRGLTPEVVRST